MKHADNKETNRNFLTEEEDIRFIRSLVGRRCLVKSNDCQISYDSITITGFADDVVRYMESPNMNPRYVNRYDFFQVVMPMPHFDDVCEDKGKFTCGCTERY